MSNKYDNLFKALDAYTKKYIASPEAARQALTSSGIYLPDGSLAKEYKE